MRRMDPITSWLADQDSQRRVPQRLRLLAAYGWKLFSRRADEFEAGLVRRHVVIS